MYTIKFLDGSTREFETLRGVNLRGADLQDANLRGADLRGADLLDANLRGADLRGADLRSANLRYVNLFDTDLRDAILWDVDLRGANLRFTNIHNADLQDVDFENCSFGHTEGILTANFGKHTAVAWSEGVNIGCLSYNYKEWLSPGFIESFGKENNYSAAQIEAYRAFIIWAKKNINDIIKGE